MEEKVFSFGGGVQSTAVLVLAAQGKLEYRRFIFANVGEDSENPDTLSYFHTHALPFAQAHGLNIAEAQHIYKGKIRTLHQQLTQPGSTYIPIPARSRRGRFRRVCTNDYKIRVVDRWIKQQGIKRAIVGLGISVDEIHRAKTTEWGYKKGLWKRVDYPLLDLGLTRHNCAQIVHDAGLPVPPKSSCYFCPFQPPAYWAHLKAKRPDLYTDCLRIEEHIAQANAARGLDPAYLHSSLLPLDQAVTTQATIDFDQTELCESGYCMV